MHTAGLIEQSQLLHVLIFIQPPTCSRIVSGSHQAARNPCLLRWVYRRDTDRQVGCGNRI